MKIVKGASFYVGLQIVGLLSDEFSDLFELPKTSRATHVNVFIVATKLILKKTKSMEFFLYFCMYMFMFCVNFYVCFEQ